MIAALSSSNGEGSTPLVRSLRVGNELGVPDLYFKLESLNPSGSYKDRFIAAEMKRLTRLGARCCSATSSGNTGSSLAMYAARSGLSCVIAVNPDAPEGKLRQMLAFGATILRIDGFLHSAETTKLVFQTLDRLSRRNNIPLVVSAYRYCAQGMDGVKSIATELAAQVPTPISHVFVPAGSGGLFSAVCRGFQSHSADTPKVHLVQPQGCATIAEAFVRKTEVRATTSSTRISGLAVPFDIDASFALRHLYACGGSAFAVSDEDIFEAQRILLQQEGIYCEPAGAAALAGLIYARRANIIVAGQTAVCLVTGNGFKDPQSIDFIASHNTPINLSPDSLECFVLEKS